MRSRNSPASSTEIGSAPLKIIRTRDKVHALERLFAERAQEMAVAEVRRAGDRGTFLGGELHPQQRAADEQVGRHQELPDARVHHEQVEADQAHVVRQRHPAERDVLLGESGPLPGALGVGEDVAVGQYDSLGLAGRAGRELDERRLVGRDPGGRALARNVVELVDEEGARSQRRPGLRVRPVWRRTSRAARAACGRCRAADCRAASRCAAASAGARR